jgi:hypothetical protein
MTFKEALNNSAFAHFGLLPRVCIHQPEKDEYSHMYKAREVCDCGCNKWIDGKMALAQIMDVQCMFKNVHRCKKCNEVRVADHIGKEE